MRNVFKSKGRAKGWAFIQFPTHMLKDIRLQQLSGRAHKALLYLASQYNGKNNGDLQAAWKLAKHAGWTSNGSLKRGVSELMEAGFVSLTRQGGRNHCSLYALTWFSIDACDGKLDVTATKVASNEWRNGDLSEPLRVQCEPARVQSVGTIQ